jgi:hypothetical protein
MSYLYLVTSQQLSANFMSREEGARACRILFPFMENAGPMCRARVYSGRLRYEAASEADISRVGYVLSTGTDTIARNIDAEC